MGIDEPQEDRLRHDLPYDDILSAYYVGQIRVFWFLWRKHCSGNRTICLIIESHDLIVLSVPHHEGCAVDYKGFEGVFDSQALRIYKSVCAPDSEFPHSQGIPSSRSKNPSQFRAHFNVTDPAK